MGSWKGSTEIILTDTKTKKVKKVKSDNVFKADNISTILRSMGYFNTNCLRQNYTHQNAIWKTLVGGILLFNNDIPTDSFIMPAGTTMTGNGSYGTVNNSVPSEMGSWNDIESEVTNNSIVMVYDFTTSQANGKIGSIALTSKYGGYIGMGNPSKTKSATAQSTLVFSGEFNGSLTAILNKEGTAIYHRENTLSAALDTGKLTYKIRPVYTTSIDLLSDPYNNSYDYNKDITIPIDTYYKTNDTTYIWSAYTNGKYYIIYIKDKNYVGIDDSFYVIEIDKENGISEKKEYENIIGQEIKARMDGYSSSYSTNCFLPLGNDRFFIHVRNNESNVSAGDSDLYYVDYNTESVILVTNKIRNNDNSKHAIKLTDDLYMLYIYNNEYSTNITLIFDAINETLYPYNGNAIYNKDYNTNLKIFSSNGTETLNLYLNPFYLATINNLSEPVYKTDSQTMKVIYTLTKQQS